MTAPDGEVWSFSFTAADPETGSCWFFTAYQGAGCSTEEPPAEYFWGTGTPGDLVKLTSPVRLGRGASWTSGATGRPPSPSTGAPVGEAFTIEVAAPDGTVWAFPFIVADPEQGTCWGDVIPVTTPAAATAVPPPGRSPSTRARPTWSRSTSCCAESYPVQVSVVVERLAAHPLPHPGLGP